MVGLTPTCTAYQGIYNKYKGIAMRREFIISIIPVLLVIFLMGRFINPNFYYLYLFVVPLQLLGIYDMLQRKHTILRNYPVLGHFRYLLESIRPEIQQYFIERFNDGTPFSREQRSIIYQRAKGELDTSAFGTEHDVYRAGAEWLEHSMNPVQHTECMERIQLGHDQCSQPYMASRFNISAMSYGSLSKTAVEAMNLGAKLGGFLHNTGEGGISPYHLKHGADLCWQIGTGYFGCRNPDGSFNAQMFQERSRASEVKAIELKISQGAKPGHGGMLPGKKVDAEVAKIRAVEIGKDVNSPPSHREFSTPLEMIKFIQRLRELSGGKPVGFKLCVGKKVEFFAVIKAMLQLETYPDFITVDGSEGGTGAAPREFSNFLGTPLYDGLNFVHNALVAAGIRDRIRLIASGKVTDAFSMVTKFALGADICNSARGMMFAVGCIQALRCNSNDCPTGVATQNPELYELVDVPSKGERVAGYHKRTIKELAHLLGASGIDNVREIKKVHIKRRIGPGQVMNYAELYPKLEPNSLVDESYQGAWRTIWDRAAAETF